MMLNLVVLFYTYKSRSTYTNLRYYGRLMVAGMAEPFLYHPLLTFFSIRGYIDYLWGTKAVWGNMTRQGFTKKSSTPTSSVAFGEKVKMDTV